MINPRITKEQLVIDLAKTRASQDWWLRDDERRRKEFAKAFNWVKNAGYSSYTNHIDKEPQLPSWEQIFIQVGRLLVLEELKQKVIISPFPRVDKMP